MPINKQPVLLSAIDATKENLLDAVIAETERKSREPVLIPEPPVPLLPPLNFAWRKMNYLEPVPVGFYEPLRQYGYGTSEPKPPRQLRNVCAVCLRLECDYPVRMWI